MSITTNYRGAKIISIGNVARIVECTTHTPLTVVEGSSLEDMYAKACCKIDNIHDKHCKNVAERLAGRYL